MMQKSRGVSSDEIDLYVRTYYSLLRSSGEVRVRAFEEAHAYSGSSLHAGALDPRPDVSAFAYAAARLPPEVRATRLVVLGQSHELFDAEGMRVNTWRPVRSRGRRRPLRFDETTGTLAVFIASESDIDDLVPILTAYQIEWNKMHARLRGHDDTAGAASLDAVATRLGVGRDEVNLLVAAFTPAGFDAAVADLAARQCDLRVRMLAASYSQFQRAAQRWWSGIEPVYIRPTPPRRPPVYFVSSNTHAVANLLGGYARAHQSAIVAHAAETDPEGLGQVVARASREGDEGELTPLIYYLLRSFIHATAGDGRMREVRAFEAESGLTHLSEPGHVDVDAQVVALGKLRPERLDPRLRVEGIEALAASEAYVINIDYPLGMAAYHLLSRVGQGVGELRGVYVMGKAATLNGRVGDVALSGAVYDEHTANTFLFRNAFAARNLRPYLRHGSVFDGQSALTVRSAFLQNKGYMTTFYRDGYTVLEMEAGPFLGAVYELVNMRRLPQNEIVNLGSEVPFDLGILHYASDTPYSRREELLSKSLSYFGVDATYACAVAIVRRIFALEVARCRGQPGPREGLASGGFVCPRRRIPAYLPCAGLPPAAPLAHVGALVCIDKRGLLRLDDRPPPCKSTVAMKTTYLVLGACLGAIAACSGSGNDTGTATGAGGHSVGGGGDNSLGGQVNDPLGGAPNGGMSGGDGSSAGGTSGNGGASGASGASGTTGGSAGAAGAGGQADQTLEIMPLNPVITVTNGAAAPGSVQFSATAGGKPINVKWSADRGEVGTIATDSGVFSPNVGANGVAGQAKVTAGFGAKSLSTNVTVKFVTTQNGVSGLPLPVTQFGHGGYAGVGGEGPGGPVSDTIMAILKGTASAAGAPTMLYPYNKTVFPRGMLAPLLQWTQASATVDGIRIQIASKSGNFSYDGMFGAPPGPATAPYAGPFIRHPIPQDVWQKATESAGGADTLTVSVTFAIGGKAVGPVTETWTVAPSPLSGTIYYQSYGTHLSANYGGDLEGKPFGASVLKIKVGDSEPTVVAGTTQEGCRICHSVAAGGSYLVTRPTGIGATEQSLYSLQTDAEVAPNPFPADAGASDNYPALSPDGSLMLLPDGKLYSVPSGAALTTKGLDAVPLTVTPMFSPDGTKVVFNNNGPQLMYADFDKTTLTFTVHPNPLVNDPGGGPLAASGPGWPAFLPSSAAVVFHEQLASADEPFGTRSGAKAQLQWVDIATAKAHPLDALNGKNPDGSLYLPTGAQVTVPSVSCTADKTDVVNDAKGRTYDAAHPDDSQLNYEPTVLPVASGGFAWVVFTSRRLYGNVATLPPYCSDPRGSALEEPGDGSTQSAHITTKKLWVAAVDLNAPPGSDASFPAFYLPAQELYAGNARGFWVLDPCHADGDPCTEGDQCCGGFCQPDGANGAYICANKTATCSMDNEKCTTAGDCCTPDATCTGGFCTPPVTCAQDLQTCSASFPCCDKSESCTNGVCTKPPTCSPSGGACNAAADCCNTTQVCTDHLCTTKPVMH